MSEIIQIPRNSEYAKTPVFRVDGELVCGVRRSDILPHSSDAVLEVRQAWQHRLDLIANDVYGDVNLWWIIADANAIIDPMTELAAGTKIRIPSKERVAFLISRT